MLSSQSNPSRHVWKFFRAGGLDQVKIESGADLLALDKLDQKLWVALSCPTRGLEFDAKTLDFIDSDKDGRIRVPEILSAVRWTVSMVKDPQSLVQGDSSLPLSAINDQTESGAKLLAAAHRALANLGKPSAQSISIADVTDTKRIFSQTQFNGDGIIAADSVEDPQLAAVIKDILSVLPGTADRTGAVGLSQADIDLFFKEAALFSAWWQKAIQPSEGAPQILIFGAMTLAAWDALKGVRAKIDDYFTRCRLAAFDARAAAPMNRAETEFAAIAPKTLATSSPEIASLPLARVDAWRPLPLTAESINPAWQKTMEQFRQAVILPAFGTDKSTLSQAEWTALLARFQPYQDWDDQKSGALVEKLGLPRVRQILAGPSQAQLTQMVQQDIAVAPALAEITNVEKLVRYNRDLVRLLNNFVSFSDFYAKDRLAMFQAGTLYIDGRSCHLCVRVANAETHSALGNLGKTYLAYCELTRPASKEKITIAAAFTGGDSDQLRIGRNGIFYDRNGLDWDATIVRTVEHPISIRQAFWSPYKRIGRMVSEQVQKLATDREKVVMDKAADRIERTTTTAVTGKAPDKPRIDTGTLAAIGMIMTGLVSALSTVLAGVLGLVKERDAWWKVPLVIAGSIIAVSGPSMIITWLKLRTRDLAPILDGCGWAINSRVKLNMALGRVLTEIAVVPKAASRSLEDLYPDDHIPRRVWITLLVVAVVVTLLCTDFLLVRTWLYDHVWANHLKSVFDTLWPSRPVLEDPFDWF
jgi:hypothetical protein